MANRPASTSNQKLASQLKPGDVVGSGDKVIRVYPGAKILGKPSLDFSKVTIELESPDGRKRTAIWNKATPISVKALE